jgi:hypothetical protein
MRGAVAWILGIALAANGFVMLGAPAAWYAAVRSTPISSATSASLMFSAARR